MLQHESEITFPRHHHLHKDAEVYWWYLFGFLSNRYTLMSRFWRFRSRGAPGDGWMAAYALTEANTGMRHTATYVDKEVFAQTQKVLERLLRRTSDIYLETALEMMREGQLFAPYRDAWDVSCNATDSVPVEIRVGPCRFQHDAEAGTLHLHIADGDTKIDTIVNLAGDGYLMGDDGHFRVGGNPMHGYTYPQAKATARITVPEQDDHFSAVFWFDHQWGDWVSHHSTRNFYHPEWTYYAILLDDGRSLVFYEDRQLGRDEHDRTFAYVLMWNPDGTTCRPSAVDITVRDHNESLRTHNLCEYGWAIDFPEMDGKLDLTPFHPNHEVFVFLKQRGIQELPCHVDGSLDGVPVHGTGFVESFGETMDINEFFWGQNKSQLALQLESFLPRRCDAAWMQRIVGSDAELMLDPGTVEHALIDPIWSMMERGGKGWRSTWLMICCHALGCDDIDNKLRTLLPVVELLHTGSLVIDDIQDGSTLRRGRPALHVEIGQELAINVGNFMYFLPLCIIDELDWVSDRQRAEIYAAIIMGLRQAHVGQAMDSMWANGRIDLHAAVRPALQS